VGFVDNQSFMAQMNSQDFLNIYNLEGYLLDTVRPRFHSQGYIDAFDFFCIVIWKANRAKTKIAQRLMREGSDLDDVVRKMTGEIHSQTSDKERYRCLSEKWGFRLPMASAILTILYPESFTVYDIRVCDMLGRFHNIADIPNLDSRWEQYCLFKINVEAAVPGEYSLRDKDRILWAESFTTQLNKDIKTGFATQLKSEFD